LALLHAAGRLRGGETLRHRSIVDSVFAGRVTGETLVAGRPAVTTEVEGSAHLVGQSRFTLDPGDPLGTGFLLR
jgi:proline racemase